MPRTQGVQNLISAYRLLSDDDSWGDCMSWWFHIADEIHFNRDAIEVPTEWQFRPSPLGPANEDDDMVAEIVREASDEDLLAFGAMMNRLAGILKAAGKDY